MVWSAGGAERHARVPRIAARRISEPGGAQYAQVPTARRRHGGAAAGVFRAA